MLIFPVKFVHMYQYWLMIHCISNILGKYMTSNVGWLTNAP